VEQMIVLKHVEPLVQLAATLVVGVFVMIHAFIQQLLDAAVHVGLNVI
jgi:hypothetical protein